MGDGDGAGRREDEPTQTEHQGITRGGAAESDEVDSDELGDGEAVKSWAVGIVLAGEGGKRRSAFPLAVLLR